MNLKLLGILSAGGVVKSARHPTAGFRVSGKVMGYSGAAIIAETGAAPMETLTTGVDLIEIARVAGVLARYGHRFLGRVYTPEEIDYCRGRPANLAARFAAKEAAMKALGTGIRGVSWQDIEVVRAESGAPSLRLHGRAKARAARLGVEQMALSLSHSREYAVAMVVAQVRQQIQDDSATGLG